MKHSAISLTLVALVAGLMGLLESIFAVPAQSTVLAAAALPFLLHSALAWIGLWVSFGVFKRTHVFTRIIGAILVFLSIGVLALAFGRLSFGSYVNPVLITRFGLAGILVSLAIGFLYAHEQTNAGPTLKSVWAKSMWTLARNDIVISALVLAVGLATLATRSNIADIAVGGVLGVFFLLDGLRLLWRGALQPS